MTANEEVQKELIRLIEKLGTLAKEAPVTLWETKTPFLRALDRLIEALRGSTGEERTELRVEVNILSAYVDFCRGQAATVARIPPTSGDTGPEDPTPVCR